VFIRRLLPVVLLFAVSACGSASSTAPSTSVGVFTTTDLVIGTGATATTGSRVIVNYATWLYDTSKANGKGTEIDPGPGPLNFVIGSGSLVKGFEQGVIGMRVGGQRRVICPPELAYGSNPPSGVPVNATLVFDISLTSSL
jgi:FKBP-type peptidyl-prolyl cis-trans isomerase